MRQLILASLFLSTALHADLTQPLNPVGGSEHMPEWENPPVQYYDHEDVYTEILDFEDETGHSLEMNIRICIEKDCQLFYHLDTSDKTFGTFNIAKKKKTTGSKGSGIQPVLNAIGKGVSVGAKIKVEGLKVNTDGSFEIKKLEMWGGAGVGTDAPEPGKEDGKQVHKH